MWSPDMSCLSINENNMVLNKIKFPNCQRLKSSKRKMISTEVTEKRRKLSTETRTLMKRSLSFGDSPLNTGCDGFENLLTEETYIADGSRPYQLPVVNGQHTDIKCITPDTLNDVLRGQYSDVISSYRIIDCRYPYEYNGGHIKGAENRFTEEQINELLYNTQHNGDQRGEIIIFHCEFSSKRGPKLLRHLRKRDREINSSVYPRLNYPEIYLLQGGYKAFFNANKNICEPSAYVPMLHEDHKVEVRHFRSKTSRSKRTCSEEMKRVVLPQRLLFSMC